MVVHQLKTAFFEKFEDAAFVPNVQLGEAGSLGRVSATATEVVQNRDLVAKRQVAVGDMRTDESGSAGDQNPHEIPLLLKNMNSSTASLSFI
jgi:hypothetical protein